MKDQNAEIFSNLFKAVCEKCFGYALNAPLSESDSKLLANQIFEKTGLVVGAKSIKNYSFYVLQHPDGKKENPSVATLDTLARYVLNAPYTDEIKRKQFEDHHPYWFQFRNQFVAKSAGKQNAPSSKINRAGLIGGVVLLIAGISLFLFLDIKNQPKAYFESFDHVTDDSLKAKGWSLNYPDSSWWDKRNLKSGHLTLYTLRGDNWSTDQETKTGIKNLLIRSIDGDCFSCEIHLSDFIPHSNWQQAGILLAEDAEFKGKVLRLSISYNDFFGGYEKPAEIIIQGLSSTESGNLSKPEEFAHFTLFNIKKEDKELVGKNLANSALKIEKKGNHFRFLYSTGSGESFAFKEVASRIFDIQPIYLGLFAMKGIADKEDPLAVNFDSFQMTRLDCK